MNCFKLFALCALGGALVHSASAQMNWIYGWNDSTNSVDQASAMTGDAAGNVYVTGKSYGATKYDFETIKYDEHGNILWSQRYNNALHNLDDIPTHIAVDKNGNVYVLGLSYDSATDAQATVVQYMADGTPGFVDSSSIGTGVPTPAGIGTDSDGNVYFAYSEGTGALQTTSINKLSPVGVFEWFHTYNFGLKGCGARSLVVDAVGHSYLGGFSVSSGGLTRPMILKHGPTGILAWEYFYAVPSGGQGSVAALAVDASANVYVTGYQVVGTHEDALTLKVSASGVGQWQRAYDGPDHLLDRGKFIGIDSLGNAVVAGDSQYMVPGYKPLVIKYAPSGTMLGFNTVNLSSNADSFTQGLALDAANGAWIAVRAKYSSSSTTYTADVFYFDSNLVDQTGTGFAGSEDYLVAGVYSSAVGHVSFGLSRHFSLTNWDFFTGEEVFAPHAVNDTFYVNYNHGLTESRANGVLANDLWSLGATWGINGGPMHGGVALPGDGSFTYTPTAGFYGTDSFTYKVFRDSLASNLATVQLVIVPALASLSLSPASVHGGSPSIGTLTLNHVTSDTNVVVHLASSNAAATVPATVSFPAGVSSKTFTVATSAVAAPKSVTVTATWNGNVKTASLTVNP